MKPDDIRDALALKAGGSGDNQQKIGSMLIQNLGDFEAWEKTHDRERLTRLINDSVSSSLLAAGSAPGIPAAAAPKI